MVRETKADLVRRAAFQVGLLSAAHRICKRKMLKRTQIACAGYLLLHLYDYATREPIPKAPTLNYTLANIGEEYCLSVARFYPSDLRRIMQHLHLADSYTTQSGSYTTQAMLFSSYAGALPASRSTRPSSRISLGMTRLPASSSSAISSLSSCP